MDFYSLHAADVISAIEFDKNGDHLAAGDKGGRVVIFESDGGKDVRIAIFFFFKISASEEWVN